LTISIPILFLFFIIPIPFLHTNSYFPSLNLSTFSFNSLSLSLSHPCRHTNPLEAFWVRFNYLQILFLFLHKVYDNFPYFYFIFSLYILKCLFSLSCRLCCFHNWIFAPPVSILQPHNKRKKYTSNQLLRRSDYGHLSLKIYLINNGFHIIEISESTKISGFLIYLHDRSLYFVNRLQEDLRQFNVKGIKYPGAFFLTSWMLLVLCWWPSILTSNPISAT